MRAAPTAPLLYVFADPNCIFCYRFYKMAEPLVSSGRLQLRWVMVAFLQSSSAAKAAAILSASDPRAALHQDEDRFDVTHESGGIAPAGAQDKALQALLQAHGSALDAIGRQWHPHPALSRPARPLGGADRPAPSRLAEPVRGRQAAAREAERLISRRTTISRPAGNPKD